MNFDFYRTFYYVGKYQSITAAAKALYVTQPTVTHAIQSLERELGCSLFIRSQKGVRFTPEGEKFYTAVAAACETIFQAEARLEASKIFQRASSPSEPVKQHCTIISYQSWLIFAKNIPESI